MTVIRASGPPDSVLVTDGADGQGRSALATVRALAAAGISVGVTTSGPAGQNLAAASRFCSASVPVPPSGTDGYANALSGLSEDGKWGWIIPASDAAVLTLLPDHHRFVDKAVWGARAVDAGFDVPPTIHADSVADLDETELQFPLVIKPTVARSPAQRIESVAALREVAVAGPVLAQPFLTDTLRSISAVIAGGRLVAAVHQRYLRTWPVPCGTSSLAVTVPPDEAAERHLLALLHGFDGIVQIQLAGRYLLDVNARVYGSLPLAIASGVNLPVLALHALGPRDGSGLTAPAPTVRARVGTVYRWLEGDWRNLAANMTERSPISTAAALLPHPGAAHSLWSVTDPRPVVTRLRVALDRGRHRHQSSSP